MKGIRLYNGLIGDDDDNNGLVRAARDLSNAFNNFLGALDPSERRVSYEVLVKCLLTHPLTHYKYLEKYSFSRNTISRFFARFAKVYCN